MTSLWYIKWKLYKKKKSKRILSFFGKKLKETQVEISYSGWFIKAFSTEMTVNQN